MGKSFRAYPIRRKLCCKRAVRTSEVDIRHELLILLGEWALPIKHSMFGVIIRQKAICLILTIGSVVGRRVAPHVYVPTFVISPHAAEQFGTGLVSGGFSTQRSRVENHKRTCRVEMANEPAINKLGWAIIIRVLAILGFAWQWLTSDKVYDKHHGPLQQHEQQGIQNPTHSLAMTRSCSYSSSAGRR